METATVPLPPPGPPTAAAPVPATRSRAIAWALGAIVAAAAALRFASLGIQSYHHDEVITVMRVIPGSFSHMLHEVKVSESNPPLYYVLAWVWARIFGFGEVGLRSLSALLGTAVVPVGYLIGSRLSGRRTGLVLAGLLAVNPMLIWYSQEARSYALLVLFCALSFLFFLRAREEGRRRDIGLWALTSALALCSHYFAVFPVGIEAAWLLVRLRSRPRDILPAVAAVALTGLALVPLILLQANPVHIGWIEKSPMPLRYLETGVSFLIGETGHVIAEPPRHVFALVPAALVALALSLLAATASARERRAAAVALVVGIGVGVGAGLAALLGKDYVVERNLLPALVPLVAAVAVACSLRSARRAGAAIAVALCAYWLAFDVYVTQTPNMQRPNLRGVAQAIGPARVPRAIVGWRLAADPIRWYLGGKAPRMYSGWASVREVDLVSKPRAARSPVNLNGFREVQRLKLERLILTRYVSPKPMRLSYPQLRALPTGFGKTGVVLNGPFGWRPGGDARTVSRGQVLPG